MPILCFLIWLTVIVVMCFEVLLCLCDSGVVGAAANQAYWMNDEVVYVTRCCLCLSIVGKTCCMHVGVFVRTYMCVSKCIVFALLYALHTEHV